MARLPSPGGDNGTWGIILNDFLEVAHDSDGALKPETVGAAQLTPHSVGDAALVDDSVAESKLTPGVRAKLNASTPVLADGSVTTEKLADAAVTAAKIDGLGAADGVASLGSDGRLPDAQLPSRLSDETLGAAFDEKADAAALSGYVPASRTVNGKPLSGNVTLDAADVDARLGSWVPDWTDVAGKPTVFAPIIGNGAADAVAGNDSRLSDQRVPVANSVDNTKVADEALAQAKVSGLVADLADKLASATTITDPTNGSWANVTIADDGSSTSNWSDRFRVVFAPQSGAERPTFWLNEYGEFRGLPAKNSTVAGRFFAALDAAGYGARSGTVPVLEVSDFRDGARTTIFGVYKGGRVTMTRLEANETRTANAGTPWIVENLNYSLGTDSTDHLRILVQGVAKFWMNEWGAIRGTAPYNWGDALVRAIRDIGDGISDGTGVAGSGRAFELVDRRIASPATITTAEHETPSNVAWGVRWKDGRMVQGGNLVGAVYTLEEGQGEGDIPATLPPGTLIVRKTT